jgi:hypothetical protein
MARRISGMFFAVLMLVVCTVQAETIKFKITNVSPQNGIWIMRPWIGVHDGGFYTYKTGEVATSAVQHIAEDGVTGDPANTLVPPNACTGLAGLYSGSSTDCMFGLFNSYSNHGPQASLGNPTKPGGGTSLATEFNVSRTDANNRFLSYLVMVIPSNDAFFGTDAAHPIRLFDKGLFNGGEGAIHFYVMGNQVLDSGTEVNDEGGGGQMDTAFLNQGVNGTGTHPDANPTVHVHPGFIAGGPILTGANGFMSAPGPMNVFTAGDFKQPGYVVAEVSIEFVPELDELKTLLNSFGLSQKVWDPLEDRLEVARFLLDHSRNSRGACELLESFSRQVKSQSGKGIPASAASQLLAKAAQTSDAADCK